MKRSFFHICFILAQVYLLAAIVLSLLQATEDVVDLVVWYWHGPASAQLGYLYDIPILAPFAVVLLAIAYVPPVVGFLIAVYGVVLLLRKPAEALIRFFQTAFTL